MGLKSPDLAPKVTIGPAQLGGVALKVTIPRPESHLTSPEKSRYLAPYVTVRAIILFSAEPYGF